MSTHQTGQKVRNDECDISESNSNIIRPNNYRYVPFSSLLFALNYFIIIAAVSIQSCESNTTSTNLRLGGLSSPVIGALELCINGSWSQVISDSADLWSLQDSIVVCQSLGYQSAANVHLGYKTRFVVN